MTTLVALCENFGPKLGFSTGDNTQTSGKVVTVSRSVVYSDGRPSGSRSSRLSSCRRHVELMVHATSPSVVCDPDAVDMESAEEGWRSEDPQRRGVAVRCADGVLSGLGRGAAPPARHTAARDVARPAAPRRCPSRARPRCRRYLARLSTSWTIPVVFADVMASASIPASVHRRRPRVRSPRDRSARRERSFRPMARPTTDHTDDGVGHCFAETGAVGVRCGRCRAETGAAPLSPGAPEHHGRYRVVVRRTGGYVRQPDPGLRDSGDRDRPLDRCLAAVHGRRSRGAQSRAGHRPRPGHVLPAGELVGRCDRGAPQLVSPCHPPAAAPFVA